MAIVKEVPEPWKDNVDRLWRAACRSYAIIWGLLGNSMRELGTDGIETLKKAMRKVAETQAPKAFESGRFERNARGIAKYMEFADATLGMFVEVPEATERRAVFRILKCPLYEEPRTDTTIEVCDANSEFERTASKIANPKLECRVTKLLTKGDPYCEWVFELKE